MKGVIIGVLLVFALQWHFSKASCYFPQEFQGEFIMQNSAGVGRNLQYSTLNITENSIPIWGNCHRRIGNNFILMLSFSGTSCLRCLHLKLRSVNILQVFALNHATLSKCSTNEESAEASCPLDESLAMREAVEILLFKTKDSLGMPTSKTYCPIDGKYFLNYQGPHSIRGNECHGFNSTLDSCPAGSTLNVRLRNCTSDSSEIKFDCLGHWKGPNEDNFLVFTDNRHSTDNLPQYRCAMYKQHSNGDIFMALGSDSTCYSNLYNSSSGFENFILTPNPEKPWPLEVSFAMCSFPKWMYGDWEHVTVDVNTMIYKDHSSLKTYTIKCVGVMEDSDKYLVFSRSQCDEEFYGCIRIANRSNNILEFQIGTQNSKNKDVFTLCADENFQEDTWITQGRLLVGRSASVQVAGMCPITGEYTGKIPDATDLCAKLWSDCRAPDLMYYQVSHCESEEVYEEREYQCLGHWREGNVLYTYTKRNDVAPGTYECFVGSIMYEDDIYIKEAGEHCARNIDPARYGMKLVKKQPLYSCIERSTTPRHFVRMTTEIVHFTTQPSVTTRITPSQDFDSNAIPKNNENISSSILLTPTFYLCEILFIFVKYF